MADPKLAFQRWAPGQILEPEHFRAEEEALVAHARLVGELRGLPFYGISRLTWDKEALEDGAICISALTAVLKGGAVVDVPGNATLSSFDLSRLDVKEATVYLHLLRDTEPASRDRLYEADPEAVTRTLYRLQLSLDPARVGAGDTLPLAVITQKEMGGPFLLSPEYVPPLLNIAGHPFLEAHLDALSGMLAQIRHELEEQLADPLFRGEKMAAARRCEVDAVRLEAALAERARGVRPHPHTLFEQARAFWLGLVALREEAPAEVPLYDHDDLAGCFRDLLDRIDEMAHAAPARSPSLPFTREAEDQPFVAAPFPPALAEAPEVYVVVQRAAEPLDMSTVKFASPGRLATVLRRSLPGVEVEAVGSPPPFRHAFGPHVDFWKIDTACEDWRRAVDAKALAFWPLEPLTRARTALFWRSREAATRAR